MSDVVSDEASSVVALMRAARMFAGITAEAVAQVSAAITLPQLRVLVLASVTPDLGNSAVAEALDVHLSNATRICDRLVQAGLLHRHESAVDRRRVELSLTEAGEALVGTVTSHRQAALSRILRRMTPDEQAVVVRALDLFADAAEEGRERRQVLL